MDKNIFCTLYGTVIEIHGDDVLIKFENDSRVKFSKQLFLDKNLLRFGRAIKYSIKFDENGYRYQSFELDDRDENYDITEIDKILNSF